MLGLLGNLLGLIPGLENLANTFIAKHYDAQVQTYMARTGANKEMAIAAIQAAASVQNRWWFVAVLIPIFALPFAAYIWKALVWDMMLGLGTTPSINDPTLHWVFITVVTSIFVHGIADSLRAK